MHIHQNRFQSLTLLLDACSRQKMALEKYVDIRTTLRDLTLKNFEQFIDLLIPDFLWWYLIQNCWGKKIFWIKGAIILRITDLCFNRKEFVVFSRILGSIFLSVSYYIEKSNINTLNSNSFSYKTLLRCLLN